MRFLIKIFIFFLFCNNIMSVIETELSEYLPEEINGWKKKGADRFFNPDNLFEYINGGAELFISYGFKKALTRKYGCIEQSEIIVDVFDMGAPSNAFGVFSQGRENLSKNIGQGSEYSSGLLIFWKHRYYISILSFPETEVSKRVILRLGKYISRSIKEEGELPSVLSLLPNEGLVKKSVRFFRHYIWLNSHYFISNQNILNINKNTESVLAKYRGKTSKHYVLLILYPNKENAEEAYKSFLHNYLIDARDGIKKIEDGKWTGCTLQKKLVIIVLNAGSSKRIQHLFDKIEKKFIYRGNNEKK